MSDDSSKPRSNLPPEMKAPGNPGRFKKGDPRINPGGRPALAKAWQAALGKTQAEVTAEALKIVWDVFVEGPGTSGKECDPNDPNWRFAAQKVLEYSAGKPRETVEVVDGTKAVAFDESTMTDKELEEARSAIATLRKLAVVTEDDVPTEH